MYAKLGVYPPYVRIYGMRRNAKLLGDQLACHAGRKAQHYYTFLLGKGFDRIPGLLDGSDLPSPCGMATGIKVQHASRLGGLRGMASSFLSGHHHPTSLSGRCPAKKQARLPSTHSLERPTKALGKT